MDDEEPIRPTVDVTSGSKHVSWPKLDLPFDGNIALGNWTEWHFRIWWEGEKIHVAIRGEGYWSFGQEASPDYVAEKMKIPLGDAKNVADVINAQFAQTKAPTFGDYDSQLCHRSI